MKVIIYMTDFKKEFIKGKHVTKISFDTLSENVQNFIELFKQEVTYYSPSLPKGFIKIFPPKNTEE